MNGTFRELWLKPEIGGQIARFVSFFVALLLIYTITFLSIRWIRVTGTRHLLAIGIEWVVLTFVFEATVARLALDMRALFRLLDFALLLELLVVFAGRVALVRFSTSRIQFVQNGLQLFAFRF